MSTFENTKISEKERLILTAIIQEYISGGAAVSSKLISELPGINASSATVRNIMMRLEKLGFLEQKHTSGGRQPTDLGYRYYIDFLVHLSELSEIEKGFLKSQLILTEPEKEIWHLTSQVLSQITNSVGIAVSPFALKMGVLQQINLVPLAEGKVMVVISISGGLVRSMLVELSVDIPLNLLEKINRALNEKLAGKDVSKLNDFVISGLQYDFKPDFHQPIRIFSRSILKLFQAEEYEGVHVSGTQNMLKPQNFDKIEDLEGIIELLENKKTLVHFLQSRETRKDVLVTIGREHNQQLFKTHSVITSTYNYKGVQGTIGVIGPTRMDYPKLMSVVGYAARLITQQGQS